MHCVAKKRKSTSTVASIETEYVRSYQKKETWRRNQKKRLKRKLLIYAIIATIALGGLAQMYFKQQRVLAAKHEQYEKMKAQLENVKEEQEALNKQLEKLDDDEYIAKLARQQYFLSDGKEIIFSVPENDTNNEKKDSRKE